MSCKKDDVKPAKELSLVANDTVIATNNLRIDITYLSVPKNNYILIECDNFKLAVLDQSGTHTPYICRYIDKSGLVFEYHPDVLTGTVSVSKNDNEYSGSYDLKITDSVKPKSVTLRGTFKYVK